MINYNCLLCDKNNFEIHNYDYLIDYKCKNFHNDSLDYFRIVFDGNKIIQCFEFEFSFNKSKYYFYSHKLNNISIVGIDQFQENYKFSIKIEDFPIQYENIKNYLNNFITRMNKLKAYE